MRERVGATPERRANTGRDFRCIEGLPSQGPLFIFQRQHLFIHRTGNSRWCCSVICNPCVNVRWHRLSPTISPVYWIVKQWPRSSKHFRRIPIFNREIGYGQCAALHMVRFCAFLKMAALSGESMEAVANLFPCRKVCYMTDSLILADRHMFRHSRVDGHAAFQQECPHS